MQGWGGEPSWNLKVTPSGWPPILLMCSLGLVTYPFLSVGGQLLVPELERMLGITWSGYLVLHVRKLRPREGK